MFFFFDSTRVALLSSRVQNNAYLVYIVPRRILSESLLIFHFHCYCLLGDDVTCFYDSPAVLRVRGALSTGE